MDGPRDGGAGRRGSGGGLGSPVRGIDGGVAASAGGARFFATGGGWTPSIRHSGRNSRRIGGDWAWAATSGSDSRARNVSAAAAVPGTTRTSHVTARGKRI